MSCCSSLRAARGHAEGVRARDADGAEPVELRGVGSRGAASTLAHLRYRESRRRRMGVRIPKGAA
eukprot:121173-Prymnesium_polylepis.1